jgi:hypothetical protein
VAAPHFELLRPAIEAVRAVLRELDDDQIPADLTRVATASGRDLPPPIARTALRGLVRYDWLRERAAGKLVEGDDPPDAAAAVSRLFVVRPEGWALDIVELAAAGGEAVGTMAGNDQRRRADDLERRLETATSVSRARIAELEDELRRLRSDRDVERSRRRAVLAEDSRAGASAERRIARLEEEVQDARAEVARSRSEAERLAAAERDLRRERSRLEAALAEATTGPGWLGADPAALASHLDELARMARPAPAGGGASGTAPGPVLVPAGIRPDGHEAIDWLVGLERPVTLVVDGYNAGFHLVATRDPAQVRRRLGLEIERLRRVAAGPLRVVVVYDSSVDAAPPGSGRGGPEVRFTEPGTTADEEIAGLAASLGGAVVVVSSDRWVREVVEAAGAIALWSEALVDWAGKR